MLELLLHKKMIKNNWQCRWSPTLGDLEDTAENVWGTGPYSWTTEPTVFFGCYGLPDFYTIWQHKGERHILWAGTDIIHLKNHYWLEDGGGIIIDNKGICEWINKYCVNWCENVAESDALRDLGIKAIIQPSFLGDVNKFEVSFKPGNRVYASCSGDNFTQYKWPEINKMAEENPDIEFHCYGNVRPWLGPKNMIVHGRVSKEQMNEEIKEMQGAIRLLEHDGFSEVLAKSILWGQWPIATIPYEYIMKPEQIRDILDKEKPNLEGREYYLKTLNNFPWNSKK